MGELRCVDADEMAEAIAALNVHAASVHSMLAGFTAGSAAADDGSVSVTAWLRARCGMARSEAHRMARLAQLAAVAPTFAATWRDGKLTSGQVAAIRANVDGPTEALFAEHEPDLVPTLVALTVPDTVRAMQAWKAHADALVEGPEPPEPPLGAVRLRGTLDGSWQLDGRLSSEAGALLDEALSLLMRRPDAEGDVPWSAAERRAEALVDLAERALRDAPARAGRRRPHLHVVLDAAAVLDGGHGRLAGGPTLSTTATERLLCDAELHRLLLGPEGEVLDHGRGARVVPASLWGTVALRDAGCRHPGCDRPEAWCDAHHVVPFSRGGRTSLANLVLLCRRHHTMAHRPGWSQRLAADGTYVVIDPAGHVRTSAPPGFRSG